MAFKLRTLTLELADNFPEGLKTKVKGEAITYKRWRVWCNRVCLGIIIKEGLKQKFTYRFALLCMNCKKDQVAFKEDDGKYRYDPTHTPIESISYESLKDAQKAFVKELNENLNVILE